MCKSNHHTTITTTITTTTFTDSLEDYGFIMLNEALFSNFPLLLS